MSIIHNYGHRVKDLPEYLANLDGNPNVTYWVGPARFVHGYECAWKNEPEDNRPESRTRECARFCGYEANVIETWYKDCVFEDRERNYPDDSDFYAVVWDRKSLSVKTVDWATTRGCCDGSSCRVDADTEATELARRWAKDYIFNMLRNEDATKALKVEVGKQVKVVKGRKAPVGTEGEVFWAETTKDKYGRFWRDFTKIGIRTSDRKENGRWADVVWTYTDNVEVMDPSIYLTPEEELSNKAEGMAARCAAGRNFAGLFVSPGMLYFR